MPELRRWNDDRLDDLAANIRSNHDNIGALRDRVSKAENRLDDHDDNLTTIAKTGDRRSERRWSLWLVGIGQLSTFALIAIDILTRHH